MKYDYTTKTFSDLEIPDITIQMIPALYTRPIKVIRVFLLYKGSRIITFEVGEHGHPERDPCFPCIWEDFHPVKSPDLTYNTILQILMDISEREISNSHDAKVMIRMIDFLRYPSSRNLSSFQLWGGEQGLTKNHCSKHLR